MEELLGQTIMPHSAGLPLICGSTCIGTSIDKHYLPRYHGIQNVLQLNFLHFLKLTVAFILIMYELRVMHMLMKRVMKLEEHPDGGRHSRSFLCNQTFHRKMLQI